MNPYRSIWVNPGKTFNTLAAAKDSQSLILAPFVILGISMALDLTYGTNGYNEGDPGFGELLTNFIMGVIIAYLIFAFAFPGLIKLVGRIWKGAATLTQLSNVISISLIPFSLILMYQIMLMLFDMQPLFENVYGGLHFIVVLWYFGLSIIGVAKVQRFTYVFALMNILLSILPFFLLKLMLAYP